MPYVDIQTISNPTTGQPILASWGDGARDALQYLSGGFPHMSIKETTAQSVATATWTALTSDEENSDIGGMHSTSSNTTRSTVPAGEGGLYIATCAIEFAADATGNRFLGIGKNGSAPAYTLASTVTIGVSSATALSGVASFVLVAGDYLECMAYHTKGSNLNVNLRDFSVRWVATA